MVPNKDPCEAKTGSKKLDSTDLRSVLNPFRPHIPRSGVCFAFFRGLMGIYTLLLVPLLNVLQSPCLSNIPPFLQIFFSKSEDTFPKTPTYDTIPLILSTIRCCTAVLITQLHPVGGSINSTQL